MGSNEKNPVYLFVSQQCRYCPDLIDEIKKKPKLAQQIQMVQVEMQSNLPQGLQSVPALLVEGKLYQGNDAFVWVSKFGEIEAGIIPGGKGSSGYSFLVGGEGGQVGSQFAEIGAMSGSDGIPLGQAQEQNDNAKNKLGQINLDQLQAQRNRDIQVPKH